MRWIIRRIGQLWITLFAVITISFALIRMMPGGPMDYYLSQMANPGDPANQLTEDAYARVEIYTNINPSEPFLVQYLDYMTSILMLDFGESIWFNQPVMSIIGEALPWTVLIGASAIALSFSINVILGAIMAYSEGSKLDTSLTIGAIVSSSIPFFVAAILFVFLFSTTLQGILPVRGTVNHDLQPHTLAWYLSVIHHAILPVMSTVLIGLGAGALVMRGNSIQILGKDYLRVARLRGLSNRRISLRYVGWNSILPMYTGLMMSIGGVFGGSVITETIFVYKGVGYYMLTAVESRDYMLMMGMFIIITFGVIAGLFVADLTYSKLDPRISAGDSNESF